MQTQQQEQSHDMVMPKINCIPGLEYVIMPSVKMDRRLQEDIDFTEHKAFRDHVFVEHIRTDQKALKALARANEVYDKTTKTVEDAWALLKYYKDTINAFNKRMDDRRAALDQEETTQ